MDLKSLRNAGILCFVMSMFEASDAESVEGLQISYHGNIYAGIISRGSYRTSYASAQLFRGRRSTFEASTWKSLERIGILRPSVWSTCHFWRKSRKNVSFLIFKALFLKEVSHKSFVFELQSFIFEGSLAEMLRIWSSKFYFWRKSRTEASFFEFQSLIFEGSLAQQLCFLVGNHYSWRKSRTKASFLSFKVTFLKEVSQKSFVWQNHLNHTSVDNQITWTSNHLTSKSLESQINWQPTHLNPKSTDKPNRLNLKLADNQII